MRADVHAAAFFGLDPEALPALALADVVARAEQGRVRALLIRLRSTTDVITVRLHLRAASGEMEVRNAMLHARRDAEGTLTEVRLVARAPAASLAAVTPAASEAADLNPIPSGEDIAVPAFLPPAMRLAAREVPGDLLPADAAPEAAVPERMGVAPEAVVLPEDVAALVPEAEEERAAETAAALAMLPVPEPEGAPVAVETGRDRRR